MKERVGVKDTKEPLSAKFAAGDIYYWQWSVLPISYLGHICSGSVSILLKGDCVGDVSICSRGFWNKVRNNVRRHGQLKLGVFTDTRSSKSRSCCES